MAGGVQVISLAADLAVDIGVHVGVVVAVVAVVAVVVAYTYPYCRFLVTKAGCRFHAYSSVK